MIPAYLAKLIESQGELINPTITLLAASGSNRQYYRIKSENGLSVIGTVGSDIRENKAFFYLSKFFSNHRINVPKVLAISQNNQAYLQEDLGDVNLYSLVMKEGFTERIIQLYKKSLTQLVKMQTIGRQELDFQNCYPREAMDKQSFIWDLNYFKYYFLKPAGIQFDEQLLENDFIDFTNRLNSFPNRFFLFRDFQSRNIQIVGDEVYFIDFQGGRKGSPLYDAASIIYQSSTEIPDVLKEELMTHYFSELKKDTCYTDYNLHIEFNYFLLIRILQVLGAYGFRGLIEGKAYFKQSIPGGLENLRKHLSEFSALQFFPELYQALSACVHHPELSKKYEYGPGMTVLIQSFSYRKTMPADPSGNGGGFVFDCRALPNPGREPAFRTLSGLDKPVIEYLEKEEEVSEFLQEAYEIVRKTIIAYQKRGFQHLMVSFGCTGGQHRSVYCTEKLAEMLGKDPAITVKTKHSEKGKNWH